MKTKLASLLLTAFATVLLAQVPPPAAPASSPPPPSSAPGRGPAIKIEPNLTNPLPPSQVGTIGTNGTRIQGVSAFPEPFKAPAPNVAPAVGGPSRSLQITPTTAPPTPGPAANVGMGLTIGPGAVVGGLLQQVETYQVWLALGVLAVGFMLLRWLGRR